MSRILRGFLAPAITLLLVTACGGGDNGTGPVSVASVTVRAPSETLSVGDSMQLTVEVRDGSGNLLEGRVVRWASDNGAAISVSAAGVARATSPGRVTLSAEVDGRAGSKALTAPPIRWRAVAAGDAHTCAIRDDGRAYCWGAYHRGQLGAPTPGIGPVLVQGSHRWSSVVAGGAFTCALNTAGQTACWGLLGSLIGVASPTPRLVTNDPGLRMLTAGLVHVCGIGRDNRTYCWGSNDAAAAPIGGASFTVVEAGIGITCGLTAEGEHYCWTGTGETSVPKPAFLPVRLESLVRGGGASSREHACGVSGSETYCWGENDAGQLGSGESGDPHRLPVRVQAPAGVSFHALTAGGGGLLGNLGHTCGISTQNDLYCWGNNLYGQLGDATTTHRNIPVRVASGLKFNEVSAGGAHTCGITTDGDLYCWGGGSAGQLGDRQTETQVNTPLLVNSL